MTLMKRAKQENHFTMRASDTFRRKAEEAARKLGFSNLTEFVKIAVIEKAAKAGVRIDPLK